jgi:hypothetical protein
MHLRAPPSVARALFVGGIGLDDRSEINRKEVMRTVVAQLASRYPFRWTDIITFGVR